MIKRAKRKAKIDFPERAIIDLGIGESDVPANTGITNVLSAEAVKKENRFYSDNGIDEFQIAAKDYMKNVYGVEGLDYKKNIIHCIGSKSALAMIPKVLINKGDIAIITVPGYPVAGTNTEYLGGEVYKLPLKYENSFLPDLEEIPKSILGKAKFMYINYPNNPTGQTATKDFYRKIISFAKKYNIVIISDAAHGAIVYNGEKPLSILSIDGAMDVCVEVHSLSKAFNMTGWRLGFVVGNEKFISAFASIKDNTDSGQFRAIQKAGIYALNNPWISIETAKKYERRMNLLIEVLKENGFRTPDPKATFFCYVPIPDKTRDGVVFNSAAQFSEYLIEKAGIITVPWDDAGEYIRLSVTYEAEDINEEMKVMKKLQNRLSMLNLCF
jgi:LL-diaminopimelate aminotransferase